MKRANVNLDHVGVAGDAVRVLSNSYGNPITVGRVYRVHGWRTVGKRKGLFPRIYGDDGRSITLDRSTYEIAPMPALPMPSAEAERVVDALSDAPCAHTDAAYTGIECGYCIGNAIDTARNTPGDAGKEE